MKLTKVSASPYSLNFPPFIIGLIFLIIGIITYFNLAKEIDSINTIFSVIFMVSGVLEILFSVRNKNIFSNWKWSFSFGLLTYIIGILLISEPSTTTDIVSFYTGIYFFLRAIFSINFGIEIFESNSTSAYIIIGLSFILILLGSSLLWLPHMIKNFMYFIDGTAFLIAGFLIFYIYNQIRKQEHRVDYQALYN
ncbi:DUF308 domain-containing protein [Faecalibacter bovis]|uniref:DUF308 domain-containing protein n=1 Tax=Faecalibacter bovis TaxID=2898187 RepID=A0ABX7XG15_9FLAO|nr:DUF308 domain-containing protein [Faecalibacter bovis]QTV06767.1 DUF308 domain-containing protein [Faecalibacter bovis]